MQPYDTHVRPPLRTVLITAVETLALLAAGFTALVLFFCL